MIEIKTLSMSTILSESNSRIEVNNAPVRSYGLIAPDAMNICPSCWMENCCKIGKRKMKIIRKYKIIIKILEMSMMLLMFWMLVYMMVYVLDFMNWSLYMRCTFGNHKRYIDCVVQNIPGWTRITDLQDSIDTILWKYKPMVFGLAEIDSNKVEVCSYPGYCFIRGTLNGSNNPRMSLLIQEKIKYTIVPLLCDVPNVTVKMNDGPTISMFYREFTLDRDADTRGIDDQIFCGDMNIFSMKVT